MVIPPFWDVMFAIGSGLASLTPVGVMVTHAFPRRPGFANAAIIFGMSFGQLVMIAVLAALGWQPVFVWLALAHLALVPVLVFALPNRGQHQAAAVVCGGLGVG
jgi:hypothetical protein